MTPVLSEVDRLRLEHAIAVCENLDLQRRLKAHEVDALVKAASREGYVLRRESSGQWCYTSTSAGADEKDKGV